MSIHRLAKIVRCALLTAVGASVVGMAQSASAQGTGGALPDPITTNTLREYADLLDLSRQQELAVSQFHDQYLADYLALREREIDRYLELSRGARQAFFRVEDRKPIKDAIDQKEAVLGRIRALDEQLFAQMQAMLSEEQQAKLTRVRQARERDRVRSGMMAMGGIFNSSINADLPMMVAGLELTPEQRQNVDAVLVPYESRLTSTLASLSKEMDKLSLDVFDEMTTQIAALETQVSDEQNGRERFRQRFEIMGQVWQDLGAKTSEKTAKLGPDARKALAQIEPSLPPDLARGLRNDFYREAYSGAMRGVSRVEGRIERVIGIESLNAEQREGIQALHQQYIAGADQIVAQLADAMDEQRKQGVFPRMRFGSGGGGDDPLQQKQEELEGRLRNLNEGTLASLEGMLGEEERAVLEADRGEGRSAGAEGQVQIAVMNGAGNMMTLRGEMQEATEARVDPFVPTPISSRDLEHYGAMLGFGEGEMAMMQMLHDRYREKYAAVEEQYIEPMRAMREGERGDRGGRGGRGGPPMMMMDADQVSQAQSLRRGAFSAIEALDQGFFDDVALLTEKGDESSQLIASARLARQRDMFTVGGSGGAIMMFSGGGGARQFGLGGSDEDRVDLLDMLQEIELTPESRAALREVVREYESSATAAFKSSFNAQMRMREAMEDQMAQAMEAAQGDGGAGGRERRVRMAFGPEMQEMMREHRDATSAAREQLLSVNRRGLEAAAAALDEEHAAALREVYRREAFPDAHRDRQRVHDQIDLVMAMEDLSDEQRSQLIDAAAEYRGEYNAVTDRIIDQTKSSAAFDPAADGPGGWEAMQSQQQAMEKLRFERSELNAKMRQRLTIILTEEQAVRVPGLANRGDENDRGGDFFGGGGRGGRGGQGGQGGRGGRGG